MEGGLEAGAYLSAISLSFTLAISSPTMALISSGDTCMPWKRVWKEAFARAFLLKPACSYVLTITPACSMK